MHSHLPNKRKRLAGPHTTLVVLLVVIGISLSGFSILCLGVDSLFRTISSPGVFALSIVLATATTVPYTLMVLWLDRNEKEPVFLLLFAFVWGAMVATSLSIVGNTTTMMFIAGLTGSETVTHLFTYSISAPFVEEITKAGGLLVLLLLFRRELDNVLDGVVYGAMIGMGFAWWENIGYYHTFGSQEFSMLFEVTYIRGVLSGVGTHATFTAITGIGVGLFRVHRTGSRRLLLLPLFLALAMLSHFMWNTFAGFLIAPTEGTVFRFILGYPVAVLCLQVPFMLLVMSVVFMAWRHEDKMIVEQLSSEPSIVIAASEVDLMIPARRRLRSGLDWFKLAGVRGWWAHRRLTRTLISLAFTKWRHGSEPEITWQIDDDIDVLDLRKKIDEIRGELDEFKQPK